MTETITKKKKAIDLCLRDVLVASDGFLKIITLELLEMDGKQVVSVSTVQDDYDGYLDGRSLLSPERIVFVVDNNSQESI